MYDVALRRIRAQSLFEGFEGSYFSANGFRYHPLTQFNLRLALSLNLISSDEAEWAWHDLLHDLHWESVRMLSQLGWMLDRKRPQRICIIRDGERALENGQHRRLLQAAGYQAHGSNRAFERWVKYGGETRAF